jgi:predicted RNase H-like nuclease (RuvC/YqgF family)
MSVLSDNELQTIKRFYVRQIWDGGSSHLSNYMGKLIAEVERLDTLVNNIEKDREKEIKKLEKESYIKSGIISNLEDEIERLGRELAEVKGISKDFTRESLHLQQENQRLKDEDKKFKIALWKLGYLCADGSMLHDIAMDALKGQNMSEIEDMVIADEKAPKALKGEDG